ncbi:MAG: hypothetical protein LBT88_04510 [Oscillospiraceae bacterium]|jgi:hypothetical protein|nr:hypothetical protein [Oscillospiraceae bacterium]
MNQPPASSFTDTKDSGEHLTLLTITREIEDLGKGYDKLRKEVNDQANNILTHVMTVLGIFVGIIIAVVTVYLSGVLDFSASSTPYSPIAFARLILMGQICLNIIFFFMYMLGRITGKSDLMRRSGQKKLRGKYSYIIIPNLILLSSYFVCYVIWYVDVYLSNWYKSLFAVAGGFLFAGVITLWCCCIPRVKAGKVKSTAKKAKP